MLHSSRPLKRSAKRLVAVIGVDWPLVPPYRAGPMSTAGDCPETPRLLVWVERIGCDGAICADAAQTLPPPYEGLSERLCRR